MAGIDSAFFGTVENGDLLRIDPTAKAVQVLRWGSERAITRAASTSWWRRTVSDAT